MATWCIWFLYLSVFWTAFKKKLAGIDELQLSPNPSRKWVWGGSLGPSVYPGSLPGVNHSQHMETTNHCLVSHPCWCIGMIQQGGGVTDSGLATKMHLKNTICYWDVQPLYKFVPVFKGNIALFVPEIYQNSPAANERSARITVYWQLHTSWEGFVRWGKRCHRSGCYWVYHLDIKAPMFSKWM